MEFGYFSNLSEGLIEGQKWQKPAEWNTTKINSKSLGNNAKGNKSQLQHKVINSSV